MITTVPHHGETSLIPIELIDTRAQIRTRNGFDKTSLTELAESIKMHGLLQPLAVTPAEQKGRYMLVIGERRLLAASMAGMTEVPAIVTHGSPGELAAKQAVENLQREDLNLADVAEGMLALYAEHGSWRAVAQAIGKSTAWVSKRRALNRLRPVTATVMRNGTSSDPELLLCLNSIERADQDAAALWATKLEAGTASREDVRKAWEKIKAPPVRGANVSTGTADDEGDDAGQKGDLDLDADDDAGQGNAPVAVTMRRNEWMLLATTIAEAGHPDLARKISKQIPHKS
jgi:ParB family chromosome partitioning protein